MRLLSCCLAFHVDRRFLRIISKDCKGSTSRCLDQKRPDHASNIKKATRYGCDAYDKTTTKQRQVEPYLQTIKVPKNNLHLNSRRNVLPVFTDPLPKVPREFEPRYELAKPDPLREIKSPSTSSIVLYTP